MKLKHLILIQMRVVCILSINQIGKESNSLEIGSQAGRVNTHRVMDKQELSKMPKANKQMIKISSPSSWNHFINFMRPPKVEFTSMRFLQLILVV